MLTCPHCEQPLTREGQVYRCPAGHTFDIARQGYVNLLRRPTRLPADTHEMLEARRRFLAHGYYDPLAQAISATVSDWLRTRDGADSMPGGILDAGCGEGYFTRAVARALAAQSEPAPEGTDTTTGAPTFIQATGIMLRQRQVYGLDLSRDAVRLAASQARQRPDAVMTDVREPVWVVANIRDRLPFGDASMAAITNMFAPRNPQEFARLLVPGALLLVVIPEPNHLVEARERLQLLNVQPEKRSHLLTQFRDDFVLEGEQVLTYTMTLGAGAQQELGMMTPNKATDQVVVGAPGGRRHRLMANAPDALVAQAAFRLLALQRRPV